MFNRILVAVDDSATSRAALQAAVQLGASLRAQLCAVTVQELILPGGLLDYTAEMMLEYRKEAAQKAHDILKASSTAAAGAGVSCETLLIDYHAANTPVADLIVESRKNWRADLVVAGTHGRRGMHRLLMGSVAENILRNAGCPVLLVPASAVEASAPVADRAAA